MNILDYTFDKYCDGESGLLDAHCHVRQAEGFNLVCNGLLPSGFKEDLNFKTDNVDIALGFHPWSINADNAESELKIFEQNFANAKFIGEIGLDFSSSHLATQKLQLAVFYKVCTLLASESNKVVSIHAVKSAGNVLDILQKTGADKDNIIIFHWFSGNSDEIKRAIDSGYYFSVGPKMFATNKGYEYIRQIPENRMFMETDLP